MASQRVTTLARRPTLADLRSVTGLIIGLYVTMPSLESRARIDFSPRTGSAEAVGDGAVAFATRPGAALWQLECSRHDCADRAIPTPPVSHAANEVEPRISTNQPRFAGAGSRRAR
jgi:hypothetical protein